MSLTPRPTGCILRPRPDHDRMCAAAPFEPSRSGALITTIQPLSRRKHDQRRKPSCEGHGHANGIEGVTQTLVSATDIWEGARIAQGDALDADAGTYGEAVLWWLDRHGWNDYVDDEDSRPRSEDTDRRLGKSIAAALRGERRRGRVARGSHINAYQSVDRVTEQVVAALGTPRCYVTRETPTTLDYQYPPANRVLDPSYFAGESGGHCERVVGYDAQRGAFIIAGSWGDWTWCTMPDGSRADGFCLVSPEALCCSWALDVVRIDAERCAR
jgi:hypothetical protein